MIVSVIRQLKNQISMICKPIKYAQKIGVNIEPGVELLGRVNWGTEPWLITIKERTRLSKNITFWNHDGGISVIQRMDNKYRDVKKFGFITIGQNCFIGANSTILCNVEIGDNCIVGANSLVTKDIPSGEVWGGVPAKKICLIEDYAEKNYNIIKEYCLQIKEEKNKKEESIEIARLFRDMKRREE